MNSFPPSFLHSDRSLPQSTSTYEIAYFFKNAEGTSASAAGRRSFFPIISECGNGERERGGPRAQSPRFLLGLHILTPAMVTIWLL